jgi:hypothetical protein
MGKKTEAVPEQSRTSTALQAASEPAPESAGPTASAPAPDGICQRLKTWIGDLTDNHKVGLKEIIGERHYKSLLDAAIAGADDGAWASLCTFKVDFDKRSEVNQAEIFGKLMQLQQLLGEDLASRFGKLLPSSEPTPTPTPTG